MTPAANRLNHDQAKALEFALSAGRNRPDRLPGLSVIFERLTKSFAEELEKLSFLPPRVVLSDISVGRYKDQCDLSAGTLAAVVRASKWNGYICLTADRNLSMSFVEAALGYDGTMKVRTKPTRSPTNTEISIVTLLFKRLCRSLTDAFSSYVDADFEVSSVANKDDLHLASQAEAPVITCHLTVEYGDMPGQLNVLLPQRLLDPFREILQSISLPDSVRTGEDRDDDWTKQLSEEISRAFVKITAILDSSRLPLGQVASFKIGTVLPLTGTSLTKICLEVDDRPLFWSELGRQNSVLAVKIEEEFDANEEQVEDI
jgi:flagellar motor switch protein FliM